VSENEAGARRFPVVGAIVVLAIIAVVVAGGVWVWKSFGPSARHTQQQSKTYDDKVTALDITGNSGVIRLIADDSDTVKVERKLRWTKNRPKSTESVSGGKLTIKQTGCGDGFSLGFNQCNIDYTIHLPAATKVTAAADSGEIFTTGIKGAMSLHADSGDVSVNGSGKKLSASVDSGNVIGRNLKATDVTVNADSGDATLDFLTAPDKVKGTVDSGDIMMSVPKDGTAYKVTAVVDSGNKVIEVKKSDSSKHVISVQADSGDLTVRYA
jgi:hypothetical protein